MPCRKEKGVFLFVSERRGNASEEEEKVAEEADEEES